MDAGLKEACEALGVEVQSADEFLLHAFTLESAIVQQALTRQAELKRNPPITVPDVLAQLEWTAPTFVQVARNPWGIKPPAT
jgi:hypothetical protein